MKPFDDSTLYPTDDPALRVLATASTLARWRSLGMGPRYRKLHGGRHGILYLGADLNAYLDQCAVEPAGSRTAA